MRKYVQVDDSPSNTEDRKGTDEKNMFRLMIVRLMQKIGKELMRKCEQYVQVDDSQTNAEDWKGTDEKM